MLLLPMLGQHPASEWTFLAPEVKKATLPIHGWPSVPGPQAHLTLTWPTPLPS